MMTKSRSIVLIVFMLVLANSVAAVDLRDYTLVGTFRQFSDVSGRFDVENGNQDQASFDGEVSANYELIYSTMPFSWNLDLTGSLGVARGGAEDEETEEAYTIEAHTTGDKYLPDLQVPGAGSFLEQHNLLGYGMLDFGYRKTEGQDDADDPYVKIGGGIGYGRIFDATDLAKAMRLIDDLKKYRVVSRELSQKAYFDLAKVIGSESDYKKQYGLVEYEKYWFEAMEAVLQREGVLVTGNLDALGNLRLQEVLLNLPLSNERSHGQLSRFGIGYVVSDYAGEDGDPTFDVSYQYALPYSTYKAQIVDLVEYSLVIADFSHTLRNTLSVNYALSLRTDWENSWQLTYTIPDEGDNTLANDLTSTLKYYITNKVDLKAILNLSHLADGTDGNNDDVETSLSFEIEYQIQ
jgi:hypothetical protein